MTRIIATVFTLLTLAITPLCRAATPLPPDVQAALKAIGVELKVTDRPAFPKPAAKSVEVTLTPLTAKTGATVVSFGLPFPPETMPDDSRISVEDSAGHELPALTKPLVKWWIDRKPGTLRSVLVEIEINVADDKKTPQKVTVRWDKGRTKSLPALVPVDKTQDVTPVKPGGAANAFDFHQPQILATLPAQWLCDSLIVWQQTPSAENKVAPWFDTHFDKQFPGSLKWITAGKAGSESYLFDRAATYMKAYVRSGRSEHLTAALQAADYYIQHVSDAGLFPFSGSDLKYVLVEGPAIAYMLTGDERYPTAIAKMAKAWDAHKRIEYKGEGFWTERHTAFGLMAYLHSYEITGNPADLDRAKKFFDASLNLQIHPGDGKEVVGAWLHTGNSHGDGNDWTTSPWMSAFLTDAIWKYWMNSGDERAPASLLMYAKYTQKYSITPKGNSTWYMANAPGRGHSVDVSNDADVPTDAAHNVEGVYLLAMGHYLSGGTDKDYLPKIQTLFPPVLNDGANAPGRKFNWRFRETSMLVWFLANTDAKP